MHHLLKDYPAEVHTAAGPLLDRLTARREEQAAFLARVKLRLLRTKGDPAQGRIVFFSKKAACAGCHRINGQGGTVGPDLSKLGQFRSPVELVESVIFPSSSVAVDYRPNVIVTTEGQVHTGIIARQTSDAIYLRTAELAEVRISRRKVEDMRQSSASIMPQGLEKTMSTQELSDLLEFLYSLR